MSFLGKLAFGLAFLAVAPAAAFPTQYSGCSLPTTGLGAHGSPSQDGGIVFTVTDSDGGVISQYVAGQTYTVTVNPSSDSRGIIIADNGSFSGASGCSDQKVTWNTVSGSHSASWTAPDAEKATLSANFATGSTAAYKQGLVVLTKSTGSGTGGSVIDIPLQPVAPPPTAAPTPAPTKKATPAPTKAATPAPTKAATPAPTEAAVPAKTTPAPTEAAVPAKTTPAPTEAAVPVKTTPAPTEATVPAKTTPAPTEAAGPKATPAPTEAATAATTAPTPTPSQPPITPPTSAPTPAATEAFQPGQSDTVTTIQGAATFADLQVDEFTTVLRNKFISTVADISNVDPSFVKILSVAAGSVVVDWAVAVPEDSTLSTQDLSGLLTQTLEGDNEVDFGAVSIGELTVEDKTLADFEATAESPTATPTATDPTDPSGAGTFGPGRAFAAALLVAVAIAAQAGF